MTESNPTTARRFHWRRLFQFRLRTLLILTTIIAVALGWWSHKARQQREAAAAFRMRGVVTGVVYDFQSHHLEQPRYCPAWLINLLGVDNFATG